MYENSNKNENGKTRPIIYGIEESDLTKAYTSTEINIKSNIYLKYKGRSLREIESTLRHELVHANDLYSGHAQSYYSQYRDFARLKFHLGLRGYQANIGFGYNRSSYLNSIYIPMRKIFLLKYGTD